MELLSIIERLAEGFLQQRHRLLQGVMLSTARVGSPGSAVSVLTDHHQRRNEPVSRGIAKDLVKGLVQCGLVLIAESCVALSKML